MKQKVLEFNSEKTPSVETPTPTKTSTSIKTPIGTVLCLASDNSFKIANLEIDSTGIISVRYWIKVLALIKNVAGETSLLNILTTFNRNNKVQIVEYYEQDTTLIHVLIPELSRKYRIGLKKQNKGTRV